MSPCRLGWAVVAILSLASAVPAAADEGGVVGWVESTRGVPVAGAVISIFGNGIRGGNRITLSDSQGQFVLPALPPGSYTLRAVGSGHEPSAAQRVTVVANRDSLFTVSLTPVGDRPREAAAADSLDSDARREWRWLVSHKRRSVLDTDSHDVNVPRGEDSPSLDLHLPKAASLSDLGFVAGNFELVATSAPSIPTDGALVPGGVGAVHLSGRLAEGVQWSLGGLVAENEGHTWRSAAQFLIDPGGGHTITAGAGYGASATPTPVSDGLVQPDRAMGAVFAKDRWHFADRLTATAAARYTYVGFLPDSHHADAVLEIELRGSPGTLVRGSIATRSLAPGGDLLTLSTVAASPAITWARLDNGLRASRTNRYELDFDRSGERGRLGAQLFDENTTDVLLTTFDGGTPFVRNAGPVRARGVGVRVGRRVGAFDGSLAYTFGRTRRFGAVPGIAPVTIFEDADFHDVVARLETVIATTDTRFAALYRLNTLTDRRRPDGATHASTSAARFDLQLTQGIPFLQPLTRADWELLLAVRNMFYEASQSVFVDELAVKDPPTQVVGGIAVRF